MTYCFGGLFNQPARMLLWWQASRSHYRLISKVAASCKSSEKAWSRYFTMIAIWHFKTIFIYLRSIPYSLYDFHVIKESRTCLLPMRDFFILSSQFCWIKSGWTIPDMLFLKSFTTLKLAVLMQERKWHLGKSFTKDIFLKQPLLVLLGVIFSLFSFLPMHWNHVRRIKIVIREILLAFDFLSSQSAVK